MTADTSAPGADTSAPDTPARPGAGTPVPWPDIDAPPADTAARLEADRAARRADRAARLAARRPKVSGSVLVDLSGHVDQGQLTAEGQHALWEGLAGAAGLSVRLVLGDVTASWSVTGAALTAAWLCRSVEVAGRHPGCVADIVTWLRTHRLSAEDADFLTYCATDPEGDA